MARVRTLFTSDHVTQRGGRATFTLDDPIVQHLRELPLGFVTVELSDEAQGPIVQVQYLEPGIEFPAHFHDSDYLTIVLQGSLRVGRTWCRPGHVRVQDRGTVYGPSKAGPDGCLTLSVYADRTALPDRYVNDRDAARGAALVPYLLERFAAAGASTGQPDAPVDGTAR